MGMGNKNSKNYAYRCPSSTLSSTRMTKRSSAVRWQWVLNSRTRLRELASLWHNHSLMSMALYLVILLALCVVGSAFRSIHSRSAMLAPLDVTVGDIPPDFELESTKGKVKSWFLIQSMAFTSSSPVYPHVPEFIY